MTFLGALLLASASVVSADEKTPCHSLSLGAMYKGAQVHVGLGARWAAEARAQAGNSGSDVGQIDASAYGMRLYRYFHAPTRLRLLMGVEGAATRSSASEVSYKTTGTALGAFLGAEVYATRRLSFNLDVGPYFLSTSVKDSGISQSGMEIVINSSINLYLL